MEGLSIVIPVYNKIESTRKCINSIKEANRGCAFEIIVVDNGSTDETEDVLSSPPFNAPPEKEGSGGGVIYIRNKENLGVSKALNKGAGIAKYDILCFMHNDVFVFQENWAAAISRFVTDTEKAGVVGLYGAKVMRKDGSFRGRSIVHAKKDKPSITRGFEKVAVVDGMLMAMHRRAFEKARGFCDGFTIHFYDKDMSLRAYRNGFENYVLNIPFEHYCATTRSEIIREDTVRDEAQENFKELWSHYLPVDVSTWRDRISYAVKRKRKK